MRALATATLAFVLVGTSCERRDDLDGRRRPIAGLRGTAPQASIGQAEQSVAFDLIDNRAAALVYDGGALVARGRGVSFALLTRGGTGAGWLLGGGAHPIARVDGQVGQIFFPYGAGDDGIRGQGDTVDLSFRFRSAARDQLVSVFLNETKVGDVSMASADAANHSIALPKSLFVGGENELRLFFRYAVMEAGARTAGSLEWLAIGAGASSEGSPVQVRAAEHAGESAMALSFSRSGRISYYARVPRTRPQLRARVAGAGRGTLSVAVGAAKAREEWRGEGTASWQAVVVDLSDFAGEIVRVDLASDGALDWAHPQISGDAVALEPTSVRAAQHVIVWVVSALRGDAIASMPNLSKLARTGIELRAVARNPSPILGAGEVFVGRRLDAPPTAADETLAERFRSAGVATSLYANVAAAANDAQGFDNVTRAQSLDAAELWRRANANLKSNADARTLTVLWLDEPALPWTPASARLAPEWRSYLGRVKPEATTSLSLQLRANASPLSQRDRDYTAALYGGELAAVDGAIATMVADLDALSIAGETAIIVVGDRGQEVFESGTFGEPLGLSAAERTVPLIIVAADRTGAASDRLYVTADAFATALDLAQIAPPPACDGVSIFAEPASERVALLKLANRARGIGVGSSTWIEPARGKPTLYRRVGLSEKPIEAAADPTATRALINWLSLRAALPVWDARRWGSPAALRAAFASEFGGL